MPTPSTPRTSYIVVFGRTSDVYTLVRKSLAVTARSNGNAWSIQRRVPYANPATSVALATIIASVPASAVAVSAVRELRDVVEPEEPFDPEQPPRGGAQAASAPRRDGRQHERDRDEHEARRDERGERMRAEDQRQRNPAQEREQPGAEGDRTLLPKAVGARAEDLDGRRLHRLARREVRRDQARDAAESDARDHGRRAPRH